MTAADKLDHIRDGAQRLVLLSLTRLADAESALRLGEFAEADRFMREAAAKIRSLAEAEVNLGSFDHSRHVVRAFELRPGDRPVAWGRVAEALTPEEPEDPAVEWITRLRFEDGNEVTVDAREEILTWAASE